VSTGEGRELMKKGKKNTEYIDRSVALFDNKYGNK